MGNPPKSTKASRRRSRQLLTIYVVGMIVLTSFLIRGFTKNIQSVSAATKDSFDFYRVKKVHSGDTLEVYNDDRHVLIRLRGVNAPPLDPALVEAYAAQSGLTAEQVEQAANASQQLLSVWGNHQNVLIEPKDTALPPGPGPHVVYLTIGGVDIGRKQISQGFALPSDSEHLRAETYQTFFQEAKTQVDHMFS